MCPNKMGRKAFKHPLCHVKDRSWANTIEYRSALQYVLDTAPLRKIPVLLATVIVIGFHWEGRWQWYDIWWWYVMMIYDDDMWWWYMMMICDDDIWWWYVMMICDYDIYKINIDIWWWYKKYEIWYMTKDIWNMIYDKWYLINDIW